jgi:ABC-type multidrug transport system fused ATPase/permease subunit
LPFDRERYKKVLGACCLQPDLEQLGEARDLTEIGEQGVTLSGGQIQNISLACTAYVQSSLVILDDPLVHWIPGLDLNEIGERGVTLSGG